MSSFAELVLAARTDSLARAEAALDRLVKTSEQTEKRTKGAMDGVGRDFGKASNLVKASLNGIVASIGPAAIGLAGVFGAGQSISAARSFNAALSETSTLIRGTPAEMDALAASSRNLASAYGGTATEQVKGFYQAISAGADGVAGANLILDQANRLAIGGVTDVTTAVDILTTAQNVYKTEALSAAEASDALFVGMKAGKTTVGELAAGLGKVLPLAQKLGVSFDETVASTAALTKGGISTSESITGLRAAMTAVLGPSKEASDLAKTLDIDFSAAGLKAKGFASFMADVTAKTGGSSEKLQQLFSSVEATTVALAMSGSAGGFLSEILADMGNKAGQTDLAFGKLANGLDQRLNVAVSKLSDLSISMGNVLLTVAVPGVEALAASFTFVSDHADVLAVAIGTAALAMSATLIPAAVAATAVLVGNTSALVALTFEFGAATVAAELFGLSFLASNPVGWAVGLGVAAGALFEIVKAGRQSADVSNIQKTAYDSLKAALAGVNLETDAGIAKANSLTSARLSEANAAILAAQAEVSRIEAMRSSVTEDPFGQSFVSNAAEAANKELDRVKANLQGVSDAARAMGLELNGMAPPIAAASGQAVDLGKLLELAKNQGVALGNTDMSAGINAAASSAAQLANNLGVSLAAAQKMMQGGYSAKSDVVFDPRDPRYDKAKADMARMATEANRTQTAASLISSTKVSSGGVSAIVQQTKALQAEAKALEQAANPLLKYNEGIAHLNDLRKVGLSDQGYAEGVKQLKAQMDKATPSANALTSALTDGVGQAVDYMESGFKGGLRSLLDIFKSTIMQMISYALKNKIMLSLGIGGSTGVGSLASAATGGTGGLGSLLGGGSGGAGILGSVGTTLGTIGTGLSSGFMSSIYGGLGGMTGAVSGGLSVGGLAGISTAVGAIAAPLAIGAAVVSFFKTKTKTIDEGMRATVGMESAMFESYQTIEKKKFWGLSKKTSINYSALSADVSAPLQDAVSAVRDTVLSSAAALGFSADTFKGFSYQFEVSLNGLDEAAKNAKVAEKLTELSNAMSNLVGDVNAYLVASEGSSDALIRLSTNLVSVNDVFRDLGFSLKSTSIWGADAAYQFAQVFGGLDQMVSATSAYYQAFYSDQERLNNATSRLGASLAALGVGAIPQTYEAYRLLVDGAMAAGNDLLGANLIQLSSLFDQVQQQEAALAAQRLAASQAEVAAAQEALDLIEERRRKAEALLQDGFTNAFDYRRAQARTGSGTAVSGQDTGVTSPESLAMLKTIASSLQIIAADTARNVGATEDLLAATIGGITA